MRNKTRYATQKFMARRIVPDKSWGDTWLDRAQLAYSAALKRMDMKSAKECESAINARLRAMHSTY